MNESLDLRNRILKMRESNNLVLDQVKPKSKNIITNSQSIAPKNETKVSNSEENSIKTKNNIDIGTLRENKNSADSYAKDIVSANTKHKKNTDKESLESLVNDNEAQFRIIANKFNEAVEVILELSEKVKKLEEIVNCLPVKSDEDKKKYFFLNIKTFVYIILTTLLIVAFSFFPIDISLIKLIIADVISSI
jgi:hypothetical protein